MKLEPYCDIVRYKGRHWIYEGLESAGKVSLVDPFDSSRSVTAPTARIRKAKPVDARAVVYWMEYFHRLNTKPGLRTNPKTAARRGFDIDVIWHQHSELTEFRTSTQYGENVMHSIDRMGLLKGAARRTVRGRAEWLASDGDTRARMITAVVIFARTMGARVTFRTVED